MKRRVSTVLFAAAALFLISAMAAFACTNLASLNLSESQGSPGTTIDMTGAAFSPVGDGVQPVQIHWGGAEGDVIAEASPDSSGAFQTSVTVPEDAEPGFHVLVATQMQEGEDGELSASYGTPARASFTIGAVNDPAEIANTGGSAAAVTPDAGTSTGLIALTAVLALAGIGLFGAGLGLFVRESRRRSSEEPAAVRDQ